MENFDGRDGRSCPLHVDSRQKLWYNSQAATGREQGEMNMEWDELIRIWIIVCPLVFLGGLIDAVAGGGGLITLPAYLLAGLPPHLASGTNKCGNFFGTLIATGRFLKRGDVHLPSALAGGAGALVGAWLGARLNMIMPEQALYYLMLAVVPVMAVFLLFKRDFGTEDRSGELGVGGSWCLSLWPSGWRLGATMDFSVRGLGPFSPWPLPACAGSTCLPLRAIPRWPTPPPIWPAW